MTFKGSLARMIAKKLVKMLEETKATHLRMVREGRATPDPQWLMEANKRLADMKAIAEGRTVVE